MSTWVEVDTMLLRIDRYSKMTLPPAYDGRVYQNTYRTGKSTISSSGTWTLNDKNIKVCLEFGDANTNDFCFGVMREGPLVRLFTGQQKKPVLWGTVKVDE